MRALVRRERGNGGVDTQRTTAVKSDDELLGAASMRDERPIDDRGDSAFGATVERVSETVHWNRNAGSVLAANNRSERTYNRKETE